MNNNLQELLAPFKLVHKVTVEWGEMDAAQHVNNTVYLRWVESSRIAYFQKMKVDISSSGTAPAQEGIILGYADCKYIFPVTFPDTIHIGVKITEIKSDRIVMESHLFSEKYSRIVAVSKQEVLPYSYVERKKIGVPTRIISAIEAIEEKSFNVPS